MKGFVPVFILYIVMQFTHIQAQEDKKEVDILWEKYGDVKADLERLKAEVKHMEKDGTKDNERENSHEKDKNGTKEDKTVKPGNGRTSNSSVYFEFHLQYISMAKLQSNYIQYIVEVSVPERSSATCEFNQGIKSVVKKDVMRDNNIIRGSLTTSKKEDWVVFVCIDPEDDVQATYRLSRASFKSDITEMEKSYSPMQCEIDIPKHKFSDTEAILTSKASCDGLLFNDSNTDFDLRGWIIRGDDLGYFGYSNYINSTNRYSAGKVYAQFAVDKDSLQKESYLSALTLEIFDLDEKSPLSTTELAYFYPRRFDGTTPLLKSGTLAIQENKNFYQDSKMRTAIGSEVAMYCTAAGNPSPELTWYKDGLQKEWAPTNKSIIMDGLLAWKVIKLKNVTERDFGNYSCRASNGNKTLATTTELVQCVTPEFSFFSRQNDTMVEADILALSNEDNQLWSIDCYNTSDTSDYNNRISYRYSDNGTPLVELNENINGTVFEKRILWRKTSSNTIPRKLYCVFTASCSNEEVTFHMII